MIILSLGNSVIDTADVPSEYSSYDWLLDYYSELDSKIGLTLGLFQLVPSNEIPCEDLIEGDTSSILKIEDVNNINNIDVSKVPLLMAISYFAGY